MKIKFVDNLKFNIYVRKDEINKINIKEKIEIEKYIRNIINKLKNIYKLNIEGFYNINIYVDKYYGLEIVFNKELSEYYDYFNGQIEFNISIKRVCFLYKLDNISKKMLNKFETKKIENDLYLKIDKELNQKEFMNLIEHTEKIIKI